MFAVIKSGGKQYRVKPGDTLEVEKLDAKAGAKVHFSEVLAVGESTGLTTGHPLVEGASVSATVLAEIRGPKILILKKRRRKNSRRRAGHRQDLTRVQIDKIAPGA
jgi:large subunit ribosomal protein L21